MPSVRWTARLLAVAIAALAVGVVGGPRTSAGPAQAASSATPTVPDHLDGAVAVAHGNRAPISPEADLLSSESHMEQSESPAPEKAAPQQPEQAPKVAAAAPEARAVPVARVPPVVVAPPAPPPPASCPANWFCYPRVGVSGPIVPYGDCSGATDVGGSIRSLTCLSTHWLAAHAWTQFGRITEWRAGDVVFAYGRPFTITGAITARSCAPAPQPIAPLSLQTSLSPAACGPVLIVQAR